MRQYISRNYFAFILIFLSMSVSLAWEQSDSTTHQGLIWNLRESGQEAEAKALERHVEQTLRHADFTNVQDVALGARGVSNSFVVTFANKIKVLMKHSDPQFPDSFKLEVAAYRLDKLLNLNFVPLTEIRELNGVKYSLQLLYPVSDISLSDGLKTADNQIRLHDLTALDFLLGNVDRNVIENSERNLHNFLIGKDGRLIAIDHARSFDSELVKDWGVKPDYALVSEEMREKIQNLAPEKVKAALTGLVPSAEISATLDRLHSLKASLKAAAGGPKLSTLQKKALSTRGFVEVQTAIAAESNMYYSAAQVLGKERAGKIQLHQIRAFMENLPNAEKFLGYSVIAENWLLYPKEIRIAIIESDLFTSALKSQLRDFPENTKNVQALTAEVEQSRQRMCSAVFGS